MHVMRVSIISAIVVASLLASSRPSNASIVIFDFSGTITQVSENNTGDLLSSIDTDGNSTFFGTFSYDTDDPAASGPIILSASIVDGAGIIFSVADDLLDNTPDTGFGRVRNDDFTDKDSLFLERLFRPDPFSSLLDKESVFFEDDEGTVFNSTALPSELTLADFELAIYSTQSRKQDGSNFFIQGTITSLTKQSPAVVPEPSSFLTFAGLTFCFGVARWWRKRRREAA